MVINSGQRGAPLPFSMNFFEKRCVLLNCDIVKGFSLYSVSVILFIKRLIQTFDEKVQYFALRARISRWSYMKHLFQVSSRSM